MGPAEPVCLYTLHREAPRWGAGKTAASAKRVALATHVVPLLGISQPVGNKNSSEKMGFRHIGQAGLELLTSVVTGFHHTGQAGLKLLTSGNPPTLVSQSAEITD
ncbi:hypothetical protein AAY473_002606, partial [Plecturocebus cupreus]